DHSVAIERTELERIAATLVDHVPHRFESDDELSEMPAATPAPDELIAERDRQQTAERLSAAMQAVLTGVGTRDRLLLTLRFRDGRKISEIAQQLKLDVKALYRQLDRLLDSLKTEIERRRFVATAVSEMLQGPHIHL